LVGYYQVAVDCSEYRARIMFQSLAIALRAALEPFEHSCFDGIGGF